MSKQVLVKQYKQNVENLRKSAKKLGLSDERFNEIYSESLFVIKQELENSKNQNKTKAQCLPYKIFKLTLTLILIFSCIYVLLNVHQTTSSIVLRNVQGLIYPGFKIIRYFSVPIIQLFPSLTDLYDESCLVENPFFYISDMECWPCQNIHSVIDLTDFNDQTSPSGAPFITKVQPNLVDFKTLQRLYFNNKEMFNLESNRLTTNNATIQSFEQLFNLSSSEIKQDPFLHISWRVNKMKTAQILRSVFPKPSFVSEWSGQSVERFLLISGAQAEPFPLPNAECSYIFAVQGSGERTVVLKPSNECSKDCKTISVVLKPLYVLWYNWWYWRPISLPTENSTDTSITYINSYC